MSASSSSRTLMDWMIIAMSPVLIMAMVGSLVFFLVEVFYQGQYSDRLLYTLFFFVFGTVLIARISIEQGYSTAALYGIGLAVVTLLALQKFVDYPSATLRAFSTVLNVLLMAMVWWAANKLTWDCTHIDENQKTSGQGVLAAAGLDQDVSPVATDTEQPSESPAEPSTSKKKKKAKADPEGLAGWWARWQRHQEAKKRKPHTPGLWVLYFSLAALPLYGLGQSLIDPADTDRRQRVLVLMAIYVASGLGLLVTTSLLGVREYLRERGAKIPAAMTMGWLGLGAIIILVFLFVGVLLPRPHSETPWFGLDRGKKEDRQASRYAVVRDGSAGKGEGAEGKKQEAGQGQTQGKNGEPGGKSGEKGKGSGQGKDKNGDAQQGKQGDSSGQGKDSNDQQQGQPNKNSSQQQSSNDSQKQSRDAQSGQNRTRDQNQNNRDGQSDKSNDRQGQEPRNDGDQQGSSDDEQRSEDSSSQSSSSSSSTSERLGELGSRFATVLKWIVWIVLAILVIVGVVIFFLKYLAPFTLWARNLLDWLRGLFQGRKREEEDGSTSDDPQASGPERVPFSAFSNPFRDGRAREMSPEELLAYSFAAYDAWAGDQGLAREPGETPNEFAARLAGIYPPLNGTGTHMVMLYVQSLYSQGSLPADVRSRVKRFWSVIETVSDADVDEAALARL